MFSDKINDSLLSLTTQTKLSTNTPQTGFRQDALQALELIGICVSKLKPFSEKREKNGWALTDDV